MFKGLGNLGNLGALLKQAQEMGTRMQEINDQMRARRVTGHAGGGMIEVEVNGLGEIVRLQIDPQLVEHREREMIEDLIPAAVNDAQAKAKQLHAEAMQELTEGVNIPGLSDAMSKFTGGG